MAQHMIYNFYNYTNVSVNIRSLGTSIGKLEYLELNTSFLFFYYGLPPN